MTEKTLKITKKFIIGFRNYKIDNLLGDETNDSNYLIFEKVVKRVKSGNGTEPLAYLIETLGDYVSMTIDIESGAVLNFQGNDKWRGLQK